MSDVGGEEAESVQALGPWGRQAQAPPSGGKCIKKGKNLGTNANFAILFLDNPD